jgi:hypothetical protein
MAKCSSTKDAALVAVGQVLGFDEPRDAGVVAVEEHPGVLVHTAARRRREWRVPAVAGEHLVRALSGLDDLDVLRRPR